MADCGNPKADVRLGVQVGDLGPLHALTSSAVVGEDWESSMECVELSIGLHLFRSLGYELRAT